MMDIFKYFFVKKGRSVNGLQISTKTDKFESRAVRTGHKRKLCTINFRLKFCTIFSTFPCSYQGLQVTNVAKHVQNCALYARVNTVIFFPISYPPHVSFFHNLKVM